MIDHEISLIAGAINAAVGKLLMARGEKSPSKVKLAEEEICIETRTLFTRYVDIVLWSGEVDRQMSSAIRKILQKAVDAVSFRKSSVADSVKKRLNEFDQFLAKQRLKRELILPD